MLAFGLTRVVWEQLPALLALCGMVGGLLIAWLMYDERRQANLSSSLLATFWTAWYWLGLVASSIVAAAALWFYTRRVRAP